jgi:hypothetical protein
VALSTTLRLALQRWSAGTDPFTRAQMDTAHANIDDLVAMDQQGTLAARPAAAAANRGLYYFATDVNRLYRSNGSVWHHMTDVNQMDLSIMTPGVPSPGIRRIAPLFLNVAGELNLLTVPAGRKYVVKSLILACHGSQGANVQAYVPGTCYLLPTGFGVAAQSTEVVEMAQVLNAGESLKVSADIGGMVNVMVTYVDLPSTDAPVRMISAPGSPAAANTFTTVYTAPSAMLLTSLLVSTNGTGDTAPVVILRIGAEQGFFNEKVSASSFRQLDTPIRLESGHTIQLSSTLAGSAIVTASGLPALN